MKGLKHSRLLYKKLNYFFIKEYYWDGVPQKIRFSYIITITISV
jgi:hypothetical protein